VATYFLDTSALIKRYILEQGQTWIISICNPVQGHDLYISQAARVEVISALCRRTREQSITIDERDQLIKRFREDSRKDYNTWPVTSETYDAAGELCRSHALCAYDAVQLACVLALRKFAQENDAPEPIFICADVNLMNNAYAEGLSIENPNNYPQKGIDSKADQ
jgi:predicted nucleic acid-binding protein